MVMEPEESSGLRDLVQSITERIEEVLETAERVAAEIQADARAQADRHLRETRSQADDYLQRRRAEVDSKALERRSALDASAAELREGQARIRGRAADLAREIDAVLNLLTKLRGATDAQTVAPLVVANPDATPLADDSPSSGRLAEEALLRATQLAVAGSGRSEIEERLRSEFDLADPRAVVDEILGGAEASSG